MAQDGHEMLKLLKRHTQEFTIFSRAGLLRMIKVEPFNCNNCFFLKSENRRLTVSRVVPIISAISSCVSVNFRCAGSVAFSALGDQESSSFANFSEGELVKPRVRISSYAV